MPRKELLPNARSFVLMTRPTFTKHFHFWFWIKMHMIGSLGTFPVLFYFLDVSTDTYSNNTNNSNNKNYLSVRNSTRTDGVS